MVRRKWHVTSIFRVEEYVKYEINMKHIASKALLNFNRLHGIISQKTELFITTAVKTSNSTLK
jgi:hypothetical protein